MIGFQAGKRRLQRGPRTRGTLKNLLIFHFLCFDCEKSFWEERKVRNLLEFEKKIGFIFEF